MIKSAIWRLTFWYLAILMLISIMFCYLLYRVSAYEFGRELRRPGIENILNPDSDQDGDVSQLKELRVSESRQRLATSLVIINVVTLATGTLASYALAKRTLRPIAEAMEAQDRFTADASHELRTPLTAMKTEIEVALRDKKFSTSDMRSLLKSNLEEVSKLEDLSGGLLKLSQAGNNKIPATKIEVSPIIESAVNRMQSNSKQTKHTINTKLNNFSVLGDAQSLEELMVILIDNALKYTPKKSTITITSKRQGNHGIVTVSDQGSGIKTDDLNHIFDRFYRSDNSRSKDATPGYGLGLSIAKNIVAQHNGKISAHNNPDKGASFVVELPIN